MKIDQLSSKQTTALFTTKLQVNFERNQDDDFCQEYEIFIAFNLLLFQNEV